MTLLELFFHFATGLLRDPGAETWWQSFIYTLWCHAYYYMPDIAHDARLCTMLAGMPPALRAFFRFDIFAGRSAQRQPRRVFFHQCRCLLPYFSSVFRRHDTTDFHARPVLFIGKETSFVIPHNQVAISILLYSTPVELLLIIYTSMQNWGGDSRGFLSAKVCSWHRHGRL